jgi:flagellar biosynthetic protein FliR
MTPALAVYVSLVIARVGAFVAVMPLFSGRTPRTVRAALALALATFYLSQIAPAWDRHVAGQAGEIHWLAYSLAMLRETILGAGMGFAFNLFLLPPRIAGEFLTQQIGLALSPQQGLAEEQPAGPLTLAFEAAGALVFFQLDGHHIALTALHASFARVPLGGTLIPDGAGPALAGLSESYHAGLLLAAPLGVCLFLLALVLAIMSRAAPQLNIYSIGFSLQVLLALAGSLYLMPDMIDLMAGFLGRAGDAVDRFLG